MRTVNPSAEAPHQVHGLSGDAMAPDWPPLTLAELARVFRHYPGHGAPHAILWHSPRPLSAAALVETDAGTVFAKRHHASVRSHAVLQEEHAFAAHLRGRGIPIPSIHANADGQSALAQGAWVWELHAAAEGIDLYRDVPSWTPPHDPAHARSAGAMLARLHQAAQGFDAPQRATHLLVARTELIEADDPLATLVAQRPQRPALASWLDSHPWQQALSATLAPLQPGVAARAAAQPRLWTHGDWHVSNLFWSQAAPCASVSAVLDFGLCARSFALFDLATAIERNAIAWLEPGDARARPAIAQALLDGYREVRTLEPEDLALVADLLPVVHLDFALSEVEYFAGVTRNFEHARIAWQDFLIGHAHWFRTHAGQRFLQTLRAS